MVLGRFRKFPPLLYYFFLSSTDCPRQFFSPFGFFVHCLLFFSTTDHPRYFLHAFWDVLEFPIALLFPFQPQTVQDTFYTTLGRFSPLLSLSFSTADWTF